ncbi:MAG: alpha-galactosidase [Acidobacteriota bacterium]
MPQIHIRVDLTYELKPADFFTRQWLRLTTTEKGTYFIDSASVFNDHLSIHHFSQGGFGQPLFGDDLFMGLEYPTSVNTEHRNAISLRRYVGVNIPPGGYTTQPAVIGVAAKDGEVHTAFMDYVRQMRVAPVRPYLLYNSWYDLQRPNVTEKNTIERVQQLNRDLLEKYKLHLNSFVLDDGWDDLDNIWHVNPREFPNGFGSLVAALEGIGSRLGLWFGPIGGYSVRSRRIASGRRMGMEISSNGQYLVIAGTKYRRYLRDRMLHFAKEDGVNYYKIDGTVMGSNVPGQGYPLGIYSREADAGALIGILKDLRAADPKVFLNVTTSMWLSPWWLRWADTIWMGGADSGYLSTLPAYAPRQSAISYRDSVLYDDFVRHHVQFPMSSIMTHGIIRGQLNLLGGRNESLQNWDDAIIHYLSVGNMMVELYVTPSLLSPDEWQSLGRSLEWQHANASTLLANSTMVLGDPAQRRSYGFVHSSPKESIVTLRNPYVTPRFVRLKLDRASGFQPWTSADEAEVIYPYRLNLPGTFHYGDTLGIELGAYQQKVIELRPPAPGEAAVQGARYALKSSAAGKVELALYAPEGSTRLIRLSHPQDVCDLLIDGRAVQTSASGIAAAIHVHFGKEASESQPSFSAPDYTVKGEQGTAKTWEISLSVDVPRDFSDSKFALLLEPPANLPGVTATARDHGVSLPVQVENGGHSQWYWFMLRLTPGKHDLAIDLNFPQRARGPVKLSGWLLAHRLLASRTLTFTAGKATATLSHDLLPHHSQVQAETYALFSRHID